MSDGKQGSWRDFYVNRADFLKYTLATSVAVWAGAGLPGGAGISEAEARTIFGSNRVNPARFPQSVASGDPKPSGAVLWTRVEPPNNQRGANRLRVGYRVALDDGRTDAEAFRNPVLSGVVETDSRRDHTVKVLLQRAELKPFRKYRYRFYFGGDGSVSRTGRFKTLPAPSADVERVRFGFISCQDYSNGFYNALFHLSQEDIDFVVHLGDYTYETVALEGQDSSFQGGGPEERQFRFPSGDGDEELTLEDYRFTYKLYKTDENLQAVHENFAMIMIWDDHEFANDAYQTFAPDQGGNTEGNKDNPRRREFANLTWFQYNPVGVFFNEAKDPINEIAIYRSFAFGNLMELVMTDERLYRDGPACGNDSADRSLTPGCGAEEAEGRTMLGNGSPGENGRLRPRQLEYFTKKITRSPKTWKIWGNEVTVMQLKLANSMLGAELPTGTISSLEELFPGIEDFPAAGSVGAPEGVYTTLDGWDGYQAERNTILRTFRDDGTFSGSGSSGVRNFVTITGDIHSYLAGYLKEDFDRTDCSGDNRPVGIELVSPSVTSSNLSEIVQFGFGAAPPPEVNLFTAQVTANNPHIKYFNSEQHGYNIVEVTEDSLVCEMKAVVLPEANITAENGGSAIQEPERENTELRLLKRFFVPAFGTTAPGAPGTTVTEPMLYDATLDENNPVLFPCPVPVTSPVNEGVATGR